MSAIRSEKLTPEDSEQAPFSHDDVEKGVKKESSSDQQTLQSVEPPIAKDEIDQIQDDYEVTLESSDDPKQRAVWRKWLIVSVICSGALCATCASSMVCRRILILSL